MSSDSPHIGVIIPAAGFGRRVGGDTAKQFITVNHKSILAHSVDKIRRWAKNHHHKVTIMVGLSAGAQLPPDVFAVNTYVGGEQRADTVAHGIDALAKRATFDWAMVHDAARPLVSVADIERLYQAVKNDAVGGILAKKVTDTVKRVSQHTVVETVNRSDLWLAQTPQLFRFALLQQSLQRARDDLTDEASGIEAMGFAVKIVAGAPENIKMTTPDDLRYCQYQLGYKS